MPGKAWLALLWPTARALPELERLACWAGRFTPHLALAPPRALLLEVGSTLRLFGGETALCRRVRQDLQKEDEVLPVLALAGTPQAALWLAEGGGPLVSFSADALDALPLQRLSWPAGCLERFAACGLRRLGALRQLPRGEAMQRIGVAAMSCVARAYGEEPDLRVEFVFPPRFCQRLDLPAPAVSTEALRFGAHRLLAALGGWLAGRRQGVRRCVFGLLRHAARDELELTCSAATADVTRFERLLHERLARLTLTAPVGTLELSADAPEALPALQGDLFAADAVEEGGLIERLLARLGEAAVYRLAPQADHRPEAATRKVSAIGTASRRMAADTGGDVAVGRHPFWLLEHPLPLEERHGQPWLRGPLLLLSGPERIESGWWQGEANDVRRDYFIARTADARRAWVFRDLGASGWFLHGWFA